MNTAASPAPKSAFANDLAAILPANAAFLAKPRKLLIDGAWVAAASGKTFEVRDPSSDQVIANCALGDAADVDLAVAAARRAFEGGEWAQMKPVDRERVLHRLADLIERNADELAELEAIDNGKSLVIARHVDIKHALEVWRYMAGWPTKLEGKTLPLSGTLVPGQQYAAFSPREPIGVVGAIIAWNFPLLAGDLEMRAGARRRLHGGVEARRGDAADGTAPRRIGAGGGLSQRACSISSRAWAPRPARRCRRTPASTRSLSRAPPRSAG